MTPTPQQSDIYTYLEVGGAGHAIVRARAGTGKTTTIIEGISHAPEGRILLAAFNKAIATELQARLKNPNAEAKTLHSVGYSFILRNWTGTRVDGQRGKAIAGHVLGDAAPAAMVTLTARLAGLLKNICPFGSLEDAVNTAYDFDCVPENGWESDGWTVERIAQAALDCLTEAVKRDGTVDFDDMVFIPLANRWVHPCYDLVLVDEAQDMNTAQLLLAQRVCRGRLVLVGDDRQAIYGFRGADSNALDRMKSELNAAEYGLTVTFRCPRLVVDIAKRLVPDFECGEGTPDGSVDTVDKGKLLGLACPGDFILSRKNAPLAGICLGLLRKGIRARIAGRDVGAGLLALVRKLSGRRGLSLPAFLTKLEAWEARELAKAATRTRGADERAALVSDQAETIRALAEDLVTVAELEGRISELFSDDQGLRGAVVCSTIHKAKGLETDTVYLLAGTLYPGGRHTLEEQNLEYVGVTRAKKRLVWVTGPVEK